MSDVHVLYRIYDHDAALLYVGITNNPVTRFREHGAAKDWWPRVANIGIVTFHSREELEAAEKTAIRDEKPRYNIANAGQAPRRKVPPPYARLSCLREVLGYSLQDVSDRLGAAGQIVTPPVLAAWESGRSSLRPDLVAAYMDAIGMDSAVPVYMPVPV